MKQLILCADDYGQNETISQAIIALFSRKRLSATSCMTTSPDWSLTADWLLPFKNQVDIGLHFNLTEGKPLSSGLAGFMPLTVLLLRASCRVLNAKAIESELHAQLDRFSDRMGQLPDFIDGHQHIHHFPVIRDSVLKVYKERLTDSHCYVRCVYKPIYQGVKQLIIQLSGAAAFKRAVQRANIPHNTSFSGIYEFAKSKAYAARFPAFLKESETGGIIMCHPGLLAEFHKDEIAAARFDEFSYFESDQFEKDCLIADVELCRFRDLKKSV